ncbi:MAG: hypothetical protein HYV07_10010 [Deltaproteobacteria bacterium]|nr:hypothetical protein [Deltaproteobacteria bacterium]
MTHSVAQTLHGYERGHRLLAASTELSESERALLDRLSDLSGYVPRDFSFEHYHTGFPCGRYYAFAKTWLEPRAERGGTVTTHTLLLPLDLLRTSRDPWLFGAFHTRLESLTELESFRRELPWDPPQVGELSLSERSRSAAYLLFGQPQRPILWVEDRRPEDIARTLWGALWPSARVKLSFCTLALQARFHEGRVFDFLGVPRAAVDEFHGLLALPTWIDSGQIRAGGKPRRSLSRSPEWLEKLFGDPVEKLWRVVAEFEESCGRELDAGEAGTLLRYHELTTEAESSLTAARTRADLLSRLDPGGSSQWWKAVLASLLALQAAADNSENPFWDVIDFASRRQLHKLIAVDADFREHVLATLETQLQRRVTDYAAVPKTLPVLLERLSPLLGADRALASVRRGLEAISDPLTRKHRSREIIEEAELRRDVDLAAAALATVPAAERFQLWEVVNSGRAKWLGQMAEKLGDVRLSFEAALVTGSPTSAMAAATALWLKRAEPEQLLSELVERCTPQEQFDWALETDSSRLADLTSRIARATRGSRGWQELAGLLSLRPNGARAFLAMIRDRSRYELRQLFLSYEALRTLIREFQPASTEGDAFWRTFEVLIEASDDTEQLLPVTHERILAAPPRLGARLVGAPLGPSLLRALVDGGIEVAEAASRLGSRPFAEWLAEVRGLRFQHRKRAQYAIVPFAAVARLMVADMPPAKQLYAAIAHLLDAGLDEADGASLDEATDDLVLALESDELMELLAVPVVRSVRRTRSRRGHLLLRRCFERYRVKNGWWSIRWFRELWLERAWPAEDLARCFGTNEGLRHELRQLFEETEPGRRLWREGGSP